jgi:hypothetical protein
MRFLNKTTQPKPNTSVAQSAAQIEPQRHVHILIETAMEQSQFADADVELIARQLAGELGKIGAALSDVRASVYALYQGNRPGAEAYLSYLARLGFPPPAQGATAPPPSTTHQQVTPVRTIAQQNQAISHYNPGAYGQITEEQHHEAPNRIAFYSGNLIAELVANSAYSALVFGERRSGASSILRALLYDQIAKSGQTILDILDLHNGEWGGLEDIRLTDGSQIVSYHGLSAQADIEAVANKLAAVATEVKRRQRQQRSSTLSLSEKETPAPYLFLIDGLSELHGALPGWSGDRRSKDPVFSRAASSLRTLLCHGPAVGVSCVASAREHSSCLCDAVALGETKLLFLGRVSAGRNGGYRAIDRAIEDKDLIPSPHDRSRYREALSVVKRLVQPVVFTPNGIPRLGHLGDFGSYLSVDLLMHYQQALEVSAS